MEKNYMQQHGPGMIRIHDMQFDQVEKLDNDQRQSKRNFTEVGKKKKALKRDQEPKRKAVIQVKDGRSHQNHPPSKTWLVAKNLHDDFDNNRQRVVQAQLVMQTQRKMKRFVDIYEATNGDNVYINQKTDAGDHSKNQPDVSAENRTGKIRLCRKCRAALAVEGSIPHEDRNGSNKEKKGRDEVDVEVEILDAAEFYKTGNSSCFVASKLDKTNEDNFQQNHSPIRSKFRRQVLNVLRKPYDKAEYNKLQESVRYGSYLKHYPDLGKKLKKYRYKKSKRLTILRGFFFWLQSLTLEGAFRPWKDKECLAIEPASC